MTSKLFSPLSLGSLELPNRIAVSPMCQYSADDGSATDWHLQHVMNLALGGAGLVMIEATHVERRGRITHGCLGLYSDHNERALARVITAARAVAAPGTRFGVQLAHAGRKGSTHVPWEGGKPLAPHEDAWETVAPSALPFTTGWHTPRALDEAGLAAVVAAFVQAAERAVRIGFEVLELHDAHGYLGHEFFSPLANHRTDEYGGSLANRLRFPLRVARAVCEAVGTRAVVGARISGTDWTDGGGTVEDAIALAAGLREVGVVYADVSSSGVAPATVPQTPGYNAPLAARVRAEGKIATRVAGLITTPDQAEQILTSGQADQIALARAVLDDPRWVWRAAEHLGATVAYPPQYARVKPGAWPAKPAVTPRG